LKQKEKGAKKEETQRNLAARGKQLFERVPTLKALFCEVLAFQSLSTILNVCFVTKLKNTIVSDVARASYTGKVSKATCESFDVCFLCITHVHVLG
jgi:ATP/ADP translocase